jgi:hypothetical protein
LGGTSKIGCSFMGIRRSCSIRIRVASSSLTAGAILVSS